MLVGVNATNHFENVGFYTITMFLSGFVIANVGMPLFISGGIRSLNNKKAMNKIDNYPKLTFGTTNYGIGLVLNF